MLGIELFVLYLALFVPLIWGIRLVNWTLAALIMVAASLVLIWAFSPVLLVYLALQFLFVLGLHHIRHWVPDRFRPSYLWLTFAGLLPLNLATQVQSAPNFDLLQSAVGGPDLPNVFWTLGATFFVLKSFIIVREAEKLGRFPVLPALLALSFVPAFSAGPITGAAVWQRQGWASSISLNDIGQAVMKIGWGAASLYVISPFLGDLEVPGFLSGAPELMLVYTKFAALFFDFAGYSLMAIGAAALFGVTLPVNFNRPYLATSIREFWRRWHMSLSNFISTYLFKPFVRATGSQRWGIFLAFVCAGIWHEFSLAYLVWGVGHGFALSLNTKVPGWWDRSMAVLPNWLANGFGWFLTMTWVALLSRIATNWISI